MGRVGSKRRKLLVVEDDAELRLLTKTILEETEFDIIECDSAEAALATVLLRGREVAMIFADIRLSGVMDGVALAREVKMRWPHLIVLLTSGAGDKYLDQLPPVWSTCLNHGRLLMSFQPPNEPNHPQGADKSAGHKSMEMMDGNGSDQLRVD